MNAVHPSPPPEDSIVEVVPVVRRVVASRVVDPAMRDDIVQETLARLMASHTRVEQDTLVPYAIAIARNLIASLAEREQRSRRHAHLLAETDEPEPRPDDEFLRQEEALIVGAAVARLPAAEREILLAHEVDGTDVATLAASRGSTPGAIAAQLNRTRSRLRVEYLLAQSATDPPTDRCRPVLMALSLGDSRRQRELDAHGHLLACDFCAVHSSALVARRSRRTGHVDVRVAVSRDSDVVAASAYDLGRAALASGVSLLDVVQIHHSVLVDVLRSSGGHEFSDVAEAASTFLVEVLASFDMTRRAFLNPTAGADHPVDPSPHAHG